ncbi:hypothetical protein TNCV_580091 [Trichonephila clavipes]|nr:hypothetical protein TNCV_580091 [Trichonephila clavipes]
MVAARSPTESRIKVWICSVRLCLCPSPSVSPNRGASPFCSMPFYYNILERTICLVHLITSDWSGTSAELPHKGRCLVEARENSMTLPNIYECNDPSRRGNVRHPLLRNSPSVMGKEKAFHQTEFAILKFC